MAVVVAERLSANLTVRPVRTAADRDLFIRFPWEIYRGDRNWVPPLLMERKEFLDPKKNPIFEFMEIEHFLAERDGKVVGRISAVDDRNYKKFQNVEAGSFGFFESIDDVSVAQALWKAAEDWCRARGLKSIWGPNSPSTNYECGLLVDAYDDPPALLMTYNPPYYERLLLACGLRKAKDLWAWELSPKEGTPDRIARIADKIREREGITVRPIRMKELDTEIQRMEKIYNEAWEQNWGFVPMTRGEFAKMAKDLKPLVVPDLVLMAEVKGDPVAFSLTLPDANEALAKVDGRLFPFGVFKLLWGMRKIRRIRLMALGVREGYRKRGIDAVLYLDTQRAAQRLGYTRGEISWTLEDNVLINRAIESMGGKRYKTYRMYEKPLTA